MPSRRTESRMPIALNLLVGIKLNYESILYMHAYIYIYIMRKEDLNKLSRVDTLVCVRVHAPPV